MHSGGVRFGTSFSHGFNHSSNHGFSHHPSNGGFHGHHHGFHNFGNTWAGWGWGWSSPWWGWGWGYDPSLWWGTWEDQDRRFDEEYYGGYERARQWNLQTLQEIQRRREEDEAEQERAYAQRSTNRSYAPDATSQSSEPIPATVLVYRDKHKQEIQNYAIVGQTLWAFSEGRSKKIPMADLDIVATVQANDERGVAFHAPGVNQGQ